jgi:hypothetical protein
MKKTLLAALFLLLICSSAYCEYEDTEGYDENTEIRIKGTILQVLPRMRGPVVVILQTANRNYKIITGPPWYLEQEGFELKAGDSLNVTGSKFIGRDGNLYVVARRLRNLSTGKVLLLRDSSFIPHWRGNHMTRGRDS